MTNPNIRKPGETRAAFKSRRRMEKMIEKIARRGRLLWDSEKNGTYVVHKHGPLK